MLIQAPVYYEQNDTHYVNIYEETSDGTFRRTQSEPLRLLRDSIKGISRTQGELVSAQYDRQERSWSSATVSFHYGRPQSFYYFIRDMLKKNKFFVFSKPQLSGHLIKFDLHELILKPGTSQRHFSLLKEKYTESIDLWDEQTLAAKQVQGKGKGKNAPKANPAAHKADNVLDVDFESAKTQIILPHQRQAMGLPPLSFGDQPSMKGMKAGKIEAVAKATASQTRTFSSNKTIGGLLRRFLFTID